MELQVFNSTEFGSVRTATVNGEVMFVGKDVADILGYQNGSRDINRHVDEEDRHKVMLFDGTQDKETIIINESGLYSLILSSKENHLGSKLSSCTRSTSILYSFHDVFQFTIHSLTYFEKNISGNVCTFA